MAPFKVQLPDRDRNRTSSTFGPDLRPVEPISPPPALARHFAKIRGDHCARVGHFAKPLELWMPRVAARESRQNRLRK